MPFPVLGRLRTHEYYAIVAGFFFVLVETFLTNELDSKIHSKILLHRALTGLVNLLQVAFFVESTESYFR